MTRKAITAAELDERFDAGEDISEYLDWSTATRPGLETSVVEVRLTPNSAKRLEVEAIKRGLPPSTLAAKLVLEGLSRAA